MPTIADQPYSPACKCIATLPFGDEAYSEASCTKPLTKSPLAILDGRDESDNDESQVMTRLYCL